MALAFDATLGTVTNAASLTTSGAAASGSRAFVFVWWYDTTATCTGCGGGGLTWVVDHQGGPGVDSGSRLAFVSADAPSGLASSTSITPTFSTGVDFGPGIAAHSWTGVATGSSGYVDATTTVKSDFNQAWTTNNLTTTMADTLLFGLSIGASAAQSNTAAVNYTERHDWYGEGENRLAVVSRVVTSAATYNPGGTWLQAVDHQTNLGIAYEAAPTGPVEHFGASAVPLTFAVDSQGQVVTEPPTLRVVTAARVGR